MCGRLGMASDLPFRGRAADPRQGPARRSGGLDAPAPARAPVYPRARRPRGNAALG